MSEEERNICSGFFISLENLDLLEKISSIRKTQRIVAYCVRFVRHKENSIRKLNAAFIEEELHEALLILVKRVQHVSFFQEIGSLENQTPLPEIFRKLNPLIGEDGILRVGGRLHFLGSPHEQKHPALLPRKHRLTDLTIKSIHKENFHPGLQTLHFLTAQYFWIVSPQRAIGNILSKYYRCFRVNPFHLQPFMGNLPAPRINMVKPFSCVSVDYGGPFHITMGKGRGIKSQKAYICLLICFATKAIHIELASDLSSDAFIAALRRFISRRGRYSRIFCDRGTNFVGAQKKLSEFMEEVAEAEKMYFSFSAAGSPHFNGLSEAGIESIKTHLVRVGRLQILTYEEFYTLPVQIEALLNSKPLSALSSDANDLTALTPGHFLTL
ncbi:hypothetical protein JTB14_022002 [Gonioctena quinquepunctata]|nr:hypothetical protein JTB14_022002 [Gonioctena quinquepunctata]